MSNEPDNEAPEGWDDWGASFRAESPEGSSLEGVDLEEVRRRAEGFAGEIRRRNAREVAAGGMAVVAGVVIALTARTLLGVLGGAAMALGAAGISVFIVLRARNLPAPAPTAPTREVMAYERAQLERQARLLERVWVWYLAPLLPCFVLLYGESLVSAMGRSGVERTVGIAVSVGLFAATMGFLALVGWMNRRAARKLRERMAALPAEG